MSDGAIIFKTELDNKQLTKELERVNRDIQKLEKSIATNTNKRMPLVEQSRQLSAALDEAKAKMFEMQSASKGTYSKTELSEQKERVRGLQSEFNKVQGTVESLGRKIEAATLDLNEAKEHAGGLQKRLAKAGPNAEKMAKATEKAQKSAQKFSLRLREVVRSALVFTLITQSLAKFREWMGKVIQTNSEATAAIAQLKGALLTMAQPLVEIIIPAFVALVNILTRVISTMAQLFAMLTGKSIKSTKDAAKALNKETEALEGTGAAADKAAGSLAGFDEINTINTENSGGGSGANSIKPDFDFEADLTEGQLENILGLVEAIGSAFLAWRIGSALGLGLGGILGLMLAIYSAIQFVKNMFDAWTNGVNMDNLLGMLLSAAGIAAGLGIALGPVAAGISLVVTGLVMLAGGFKDAFEHGWNLENTLLSVAGIFATGLGISLITGSLLPALIAGFASALLAITVFFGDGEALIQALKQVIDGFKEFFTAVFTGDMEAAAKALGKIWDGIKKTAIIIWDAVKEAFAKFCEWFLEWGSQKLWDFFQKCEEWGTSLRAWWKNLGKNIVSSIKQGISDAWSGLKTWFNNLWNNLFSNRKIDATVSREGVFDGKSVSSYSIPALATGSVVPPNREFLALLGDNKTETEVVSPLSTMKQAMLEALRESGGGGGGTYTFVVNLDGKEVARNQVKHINNMTREAGKPVLLF